MALITGSWFIDLWIFISAVVISIYAYFQHKFQFWSKRNVVYAMPTIPFGNIKGVNVTKTFGIFEKDLYEQFKGEKFVGFWILFRPVLMIRDPELVKNIFVKDFMTFHDRGIYVNDKDDPLSGHLFAIGGTKWRNLRTKLTPTFTSGKMKAMFPILVEKSKELKDVLSKLSEKGEVVEVKEIVARFTTDIIASCAFGLETNAMRDPNAVFRVMGKKILEPSFRNSTRGMLVTVVPDLAELLKLTFTPPDVSKFFLEAFRDTIEYREKNSYRRNDFLDLLMQLKNKGKLDDVDDKTSENGKSDEQIRKFTFEEAAAQAFVFWLAGFETSSTTMQFALYELSLNPELQEKTREEIFKVLAKHNNQMTYECIFDMEHLGRVIDETLRLYPPVPMLQRECNKDYKIPDTDVTIPAGVQVHIPILGIHTDPDYFPDPKRFDPERFTEEEKSKRHHYSFLPFGEGPRNCIGMRFGLMQTRVGLVTLLTNFRFEVTKETEIPIQYDPKSFVLTPKTGMNLKITALKK